MKKRKQSEDFIFDYYDLIEYVNFKYSIIRGKNTSDGSYVNSMIFKPIDGQLYLYALYRDDQIRMWSVRRSNCVGSVHILQDYGEQRIQGSKFDNPVILITKSLLYYSNMN